MERPERVRMNFGHPLATGLVFAGLGELPNTSYYHDSSLYKNAGTLMQMAIPATATSGWCWDNFLGRWTLGLDGTNDYISCPTINFSSSFSGFLWYRNSWVSGTPVLFNSGTGWNGTGFYLDFEPAVTLVTKAAYRYNGDAAGSYANWTAVGFACDVPANVVKLYRNGVLDSSGGSSGTFGTTASSSPLIIGNASASSAGKLGDPMLWSRVVTASEFASLSDPSNVMLSGLLLPPKRRLWAAAVAAPPAGFKAAWANRRQRNVIGGGVI